MLYKESITFNASIGYISSQIKKPKLPIIQKLNYSSSPISKLVKPYHCIDNLNIPADNIHMYVVSAEPITDWTSVMPIYLKKPNQYYEIFWYKYEPSWARDGFNTYVYQLTYKQPFSTPPKKFNHTDVASFKLISNIDAYGGMDLSGNKKLCLELHNWFATKSNNFPSLDIWKQLSLKLPEPVFAFRGLLFEFNTIPDMWKNYRVGDKMTLSSRGNSMSWTTNFCISRHFSLIDMMGKKNPQVYSSWFCAIYALTTFSNTH